MVKKAEEWLQEIAKTRPDHSSRCGAKNGIIPIIYGYPTPPYGNWKSAARSYLPVVESILMIRAGIVGGAG